jgi:putative sigma-54 modulation protein
MKSIVTDPRIAMQGIHVELTDAMQSAIHDKFSAILRHNERIIRINVRLHRDQTLGNEYHFTGTAKAEIGGPDLVASAEGKDAYAVIDALADTLDRLVRERHEQRVDRRNHPYGTGLDPTSSQAS